jgi:hypothetical protein
MNWFRSSKYKSLKARNEILEQRMIHVLELLHSVTKANINLSGEAFLANKKVDELEEKLLKKDIEMAHLNKNLDLK